MTEQLFKDILTQALTDLYGIVGGAVPFTLLQLAGCSAMVRVDKRWQRGRRTEVGPMAAVKRSDWTDSQTDSHSSNERPVRGFLKHHQTQQDNIIGLMQWVEWGLHPARMQMDPVTGACRTYRRAIPTAKFFSGRNKTPSWRTLRLSWYHIDVWNVYRNPFSCHKSVHLGPITNGMILPRVPKDSLGQTSGHALLVISVGFYNSLV
ncbi:hypothetical protein VOLCADRAFT_92515 [Volvox carteri f. nagariensis]|uniref:Uncharacterized protein n=1 Tax=Volvox carteri f. nagariensis TaxID=3068 RepID=D8TZV4_VOLCA|nr:uncharacterized protein VOLCADRAFT_92515 [Volvox carteri f. nagariensis]EFJ46989.1 hypothetical protein VOLCADRAFT_92515 [Volvox carteri f. nagariensis]|eukprot:XP_002951884.1 hypothetical protein VOLCADRAFT_92515 [Volvox carteri f. nagariensis]